MLAAAAMYTHYTAVFLLAAQFAWALACHRRAWPWLIGASAAAALLWAPWLAEYLADQDSPGSALIGALQPFEWDSAWTSVFRWAVGHPFAPSSIGEVPGDRALVPIGLALLIGLAAIGVQAVRDRVRRPSDGMVLVVILALSTPVLAALYSSVGDSVFLPRNMIASSPGLALLLGAIVTAPRPRPAWVAATALLLVGFAVAGVRMLEGAAQRPDYEAAADFIAERSDGERVVVDAHGPGPSPLSPLDAAIADGAVRPDTVALRLGRATFDDQMRAGQPDGPGQFAPLPVPSPESIARQALARSSDGRVFLVHPGSFTFDELRGDAGGSRSDVASTLPAGVFARALPAGYRAGATRTFPGLFGGGDVTVYELLPE